MKVELERLRVSSQRRIPKYLLRHARVESFADHVKDEMVMEITSEVLGYSLGKRNRSVPFSKTIAVPTYSRLWMVVMMTASLLLVPAVMTSLFLTIPVAILWVFSAARLIYPVRKLVTVSGTVKCTVRDYALFPDCIRDFPPDLGRPVPFYKHDDDHKVEYEG